MRVKTWIKIRHSIADKPLFIEVGRANENKINMPRFHPHPEGEGVKKDNRNRKSQKLPISSNCNTYNLATTLAAFTISKTSSSVRIPDCTAASSRSKWMSSLSE